ncbi:hypothetical protein MY04_1367 [Flammeovirga sp. MY04]|uniref:hypothetical protein n=1 Tax=Flammeovirga sp. MY04 TaxID=1191459 RepID=UPI0013051876|nr:hypothetical protein [Flammeovirga sp. MY04]ANQ48743.2 hypothetical protein MY04_1367 [Flammeovirga sp. MY04]
MITLRFKTSLLKIISSKSAKIMPKYFLFNPYCELAIVKNAKFYTPNKQFKALVNDLSPLMIWLYDSKIKILSDIQVSEEWKKDIKKLHEFKVDFADFDTLKGKSIKIEDLEVWGKSLDYLTILSKPTFKVKGLETWSDNDKNVYDRFTGYKVLKSLVNSTNTNYISKDLLGTFCKTKEEVILKFQQLFAGENRGVVFKLPFSSSGRGLMLLRKEHINPAIESWIESGLSEHGRILVEPWLDKVTDFSVLFNFESEEVKFLGISVFESLDSGQYGGSLLGNYEDLLPNTISVQIPKLIEDLKGAFRNTNEFKGFKGRLGVDAMIVRDVMDNLILHPCVEINPRTTMGHISLGLKKAVLNPNRAKWVITTKHQIANFKTFEIEMRKKYPYQIENKKLVSGFFPLVDVNLTKQYYAYVLAE